MYSKFFCEYFKTAQYVAQKILLTDIIIETIKKIDIFLVSRKEYYHIFRICLKSH